MRYKDAIITKDKDGKRYYKSGVLRGIPLKDTDIFIVPVDGDRLDGLAQRYYGNSSLWWIIAQANGLGKGSLAIPAGKQLRIPMDTDSIINKFNDIVQNRRVI